MSDRWKVLTSFRHWPDVACPYCGDGYGLLQDRGDGRYTYVCWCGATAKADKTDPDITAVLGNLESEPR